MDLADLYKKHHEDISNFEALRDKIWSDMKQRHTHYIEAFGSRENLPSDTKRQIENEEADFRKRWSTDHGTNYKAMKKQHDEQIKSLTPKPKPRMDKQKQEQKQVIKKLVTERDKKKAQMIKAHKAIAKKQQEHKRKR